MLLPSRDFRVVSKVQLSLEINLIYVFCEKVIDDLLLCVRELEEMVLQF
jgi:hypothetical protein